MCIKSTWVCSILKGNEKEEEAAQEKRERPIKSRSKKKKIAKTELYVEKKIRKREQSVATFKRDN